MSNWRAVGAAASMLLGGHLRTVAATSSAGCVSDFSAVSAESIFNSIRIPEWIARWRLIDEFRYENVRIYRRVSIILDSDTFSNKNSNISHEQRWTLSFETVNTYQRVEKSQHSAAFSFDWPTLMLRYINWYGNITWAPLAFFAPKAASHCLNRIWIFRGQNSYQRCTRQHHVPLGRHSSCQGRIKATQSIRL